MALNKFSPAMPLRSIIQNVLNDKRDDSTIIDSILFKSIFLFQYQKMITTWALSALQAWVICHLTFYSAPGSGSIDRKREEMMCVICFAIDTFFGAAPYL